MATDFGRLYSAESDGTAVDSLLAKGQKELLTRSHPVARTRWISIRSTYEYADPDPVRRPWADSPPVRRDGKRQSRTNRSSIETVFLAFVCGDIHSRDSV